MHGEPLSDFALDVIDGRVVLIPGPALPPTARQYLTSYLDQAARYRNISRDRALVRFSLYQPVLNSPAGKRSLLMRLRRKFARERLPQAATIGVTRACQCSCSHCSADYHMESRERELSEHELASAIEQTVALGATTIILLGGEPLLRKGLEATLSQIDPTLAQAVLFTNGEFLSRQRCESLKHAGLSGIFVSIDSAEPAEHDSLRGREGIFARIMEGIANAKQAGLAVALSSYLTTERMHHGVFEDMMELGRELDVDEVTLFDAIPVGRMSQGTREDVHTTLDLPARKLIASLTRSYRSMPEYPAVTPQSILTSEIGSSFCFAANTQFYLSSTGHLCPCDFTPLSAGRFPDDDISTLWNRMIHSPIYRRRSKTCRMQDPEFRERTLSRIPPGAILPYPLGLLERVDTAVPVGAGNVEMDSTGESAPRP